jgi:hypothetical protein
MGLLGRMFNWAADTRAATPTSPPQLDAGSGSTLAAAVRRLPRQERGWIALGDGQRLFSAMPTQYAFGDMDEQGRAKIESFAGQAGASYSIMPVEGRIYFTRS